jgi:uncharacterized protein (DUF1330 family)
MNLQSRVSVARTAPLFLGLEVQPSPGPHLLQALGVEIGQDQRPERVVELVVLALAALGALLRQVPVADRVGRAPVSARGGAIRYSSIVPGNGPDPPRRRIRMAKAYWISCYRSISNPDALAAYAKLAGPALTAAGGRFLARGMPAKVYEAGVEQRTVIVEFDSVERAVAAYRSEAYQAALAALGNAAERDIRFIEGAA